MSDTFTAPERFRSELRKALRSAGEADRLATTIDLNFARRQKGEYLPLASPEEAAAYPYTPVDRERIRQNRARVFTGSIDTVRARLDPLIEATKADELMVTTMIHDHGARRHSYEVLAKAFGLQRAVQSTPVAVDA